MENSSVPSLRYNVNLGGGAVMRQRYYLVNNPTSGLGVIPQGRV